MLTSIWLIAVVVGFLALAYVNAAGRGCGARRDRRWRSPSRW